MFCFSALCQWRIFVTTPETMETSTFEANFMLFISATYFLRVYVYPCCEDLNWIGLSLYRYGPVAGCCEDGNQVWSPDSNRPSAPPAGHKC
jgi:hypothetical protein